MATRLRQASFQPAHFDATACNVHLPEGGSRGQIVVLVHGFSGRGYSTWGRLPKALFDSGLDIAVFDYACGLRSLIGTKRRFDAWADQLGAAVTEFGETYQDVFLVGHSLGGLLVETVAMNYLQRATHGARLPLAALILVGSPRAGAGLASALPRRIVPDPLRRLSAHAAKVDTFFSSRVEGLNVATPHTGQVVLPSYAVLATNDIFVSDFSASFRIPEQQRLRLTGTHTSIVKPADHDAALTQWLSDLIAKRLAVREQAEHERLHGARRRVDVEPLRSVLVTEFWSDAVGLTWEEIYNAVRRDLSTADMAVHDVRDAVPGSPVDLLLAVHDAGVVAAGANTAKAAVDAACARRATDAQLTVGISPVGPESIAAVTVINSWLPTPLQPHIYVRGAQDDIELLSVMARWLRLVIDRDPRRQTTGNPSIERTPLREIGDVT